MPHGVKGQRLNPWTTREVPSFSLFLYTLETLLKTNLPKAEGAGSLWGAVSAFTFQFSFLFPEPDTKSVLYCFPFIPLPCPEWWVVTHKNISCAKIKLIRMGQVKKKVKWELPTSYKEWVEGLLSPFLPSVWLTDMNWNPREKCSLPSRTSMISPCPAQYPLCLLCSPAAWYPTSRTHCISPTTGPVHGGSLCPVCLPHHSPSSAPSFGALFRHSLPQEPTRFLTRLPFWSLSPLSILGCLCLALTKSCLGQSDLRWSLFPPDSNLICHPWHPQPQSPTWHSARPRLETSDRARDFWSLPRHPHLSLCSTEGSWLKISEGWERGGDKHRDTHDHLPGPPALFQAPYTGAGAQRGQGIALWPICPLKLVSGAQVCLILRSSVKAGGPGDKGVGVNWDQAPCCASRWELGQSSGWASW